MNVKAILFLISFFIFLFFPSCKNQCNILEEKIAVCKDEVNCSLNENKIICDEINNAKSLIATINNKLNEETENKNDIEASCSYALESIDFNGCSLSVKKQNGEWQSVKYLMSVFGLEGAIDKVNLILKFMITNDTKSDAPCGPKILKVYEKTKEFQKEIKFVTLKTFTDVIPVIQISPNTSNSNIFIGETYIKNENSPCDFNANNRLNLNYYDYDYIFCSKTSGWLYDEETGRSNCALTRQEVFLLNWKNKYFINWCLDNYKNTYTDCKKGNTYKCVSSSNEVCYDIRENFYCNNEYDLCVEKCKNSTVRTCKENCKNDYVSCKENIDRNNNCKLRCLSNMCYREADYNIYYDCLEHLNPETDKYDYNCCDCENTCSANCVDLESLDCKDCQENCLNNCINNNMLDISCYKSNISELENCFKNKFEETDDVVLKNCLEENESVCENQCSYAPCMYSCMEDKCKEYECFELSNAQNDFWNNKHCNEYSCYYECQTECQKPEIDFENSKIFTFYREVKDNEITGSACDEGDIFTKKDGDYLNYCIINETIDY